MKTILETWGISAEYLTQVIMENPSSRGMLIGYIAERKLRDFFEADGRASNLHKDDDHDRKKKGDLVITYKGLEFRIEVKSLQTNSIKTSDDGKTYTGKVQCDASDKRTITLPNGQSISTTCLQINEFDILAAGLFAFEEQWIFGFALNRDLPRSPYKKYPEEVRNMLLKTLIPVTWPLSDPFISDPFPLLDQLVKERQHLTD